MFITCRNENSYVPSIDTIASLIGPTVYPTHFHVWPEITYIVDGMCQSTINSQNYQAEKDDILFVPNHYPHSYATSLDVERLLVTPNFEKQKNALFVFEDKTLPYLMTDKKFNREQILPLIKQILCLKQADEYSNPTIKEYLVNGYMNLLYGKLLETYGRNMIAKNKQANTITNILLYIDEHFTEKLTLEKLSSVFGYNKYYFSKIFNAHIDEGLTNYINGIRIQNFINRYKASNSKNVLELALSVGFDSMPSFYRAFQLFTGNTPKEYFKSHERN